MYSTACTLYSVLNYLQKEAYRTVVCTTYNKQTAYCIFQYIGTYVYGINKYELCTLYTTVHHQKDHKNSRNYYRKADVQLIVHTRCR